jgi:hypothetical protein
MYHRPARSALLLILFSLLFSILPPGIGGAAATGRPATAALANTPVNLVEEPLPFQEWAVGGGFIYWSKCGTGPGPKQQAEDSSAPIDSEVGYLRRKPTGGGLVKSLSLGQFNPGCSLSSEMAADSSGLYYWDGHAIIQRSVSAPDTPVILYTGTANQAPVTRLVFDQNAVFWASSTQIFRVAKNGSGGGAIVDSHGYPTALVVYINSVSWISDRLWSVSASCTVACNAESANLARGHTLVANMFRYWSSGEGIMEDALRGCYTLRIWCYPKAIYNTSAPWHIGALAISGTSLFWVENHQRDCTDPTACFREPSPDGVLHRLTLSSGATAENIAENIPNYGDQLYTDEHGVYFEQSPPGYRRIISRLPLDARPIVHDLAVDSWEVTQGIQNLANDVPLVAGKPTYVRAYAVQRDGPRAGGVSMLLYGARNGIPLPDSPQKSLNGTHSLEMGQHDDRANGDAGWLFKLPDSWTTGGPIELRAVLDPRSFYTDPDRSNNTRSATFTFTRMAPVCIVTVPVRTHGPAANNLGANVFFARDMVRRLWPVSDVWLYHQDNDIAELQARFGIPPWEYGPYEIPENTTKILVSLTERDFFSDDPDKCDNVSARTHYVGIVSPETPTGNADPNLGTNGSGRDGNDQAWIKLPPADFARDDWRARRAATLAHELAHNYERKHVNCGNPEDVDENYPYRDNNGTACLLDDRDIKDANTYYGFDTDMQQPIGPTKAQDLMGYTCSPDPDCVPRWISDYTWRGLFSTIPDRQRMALASEHPAAAAVLPNLAEASSVVLVSGVITPSVASAELNYPFVFPTNTVSPQMLRKWQRHAALPAGVSLPGVPNYHLRLLDAGNQALDDRTVTLDETADGEESTKGFTLAFPAPAMPVARIELLDGDRVLAHLQPGISMPSASIITPAGGENITNTLTLSWHASDPDSNDLLLYTVQYSPDQGKTWRALLTSFPNMTSSPTMTVELKNLSGIPGSSSGGARIRVAASDGYNTTLATSEP